MKKLVISVLLINLLAACASQKPKEPVTESKPVTVTESTTSTAAEPVEARRVPEGDVVVDELNDPRSILAKRSVFYPFDVYAVQDADKPIVQAHAKYLSAHAGQKVRLEGNCDERGSDEYNLALGQRRADGVKKMLVLGGVKESQLETVSYGEEKPRATGHEESAWAQNRRTDINYTK